MKKLRTILEAITIIPKEEFEPHKDYDDTIVHKTEIDGHEVNVNFLQSNYNHYSVDFFVNDYTSKNYAKVKNPLHQKRIANHVKNVIGSFIHHFRPRSIGAYASDSDHVEQKKKHNIYIKGMKYLGAKVAIGKGDNEGIITGKFNYQ